MAPVVGKFVKFADAPPLPDMLTPVAMAESAMIQSVVFVKVSSPAVSASDPPNAVAVNDPNL